MERTSNAKLDENLEKNETKTEIASRSSNKTIFVSIANNENLDKNKTKTEIASENDLEKGKSILGAPPKIEKKETRNPKSNKDKNKKSQPKKLHFYHHCGASEHTHPNCYKWLATQ